MGNLSENEHVQKSFCVLQLVLLEIVMVLPAALCM